jgi:hypothetical protein
LASVTEERIKAEGVPEKGLEETGKKHVE